MLQPGVAVSYQAILRWCAKFGHLRSPNCVDAGHCPATSGTSTSCSSASTAAQHYLRRAVDQYAAALGVLVHSCRNLQSRLNAGRGSRRIGGRHYYPSFERLLAFVALTRQSKDWFHRRRRRRGPRHSGITMWCHIGNGVRASLPTPDVLWSASWCAGDIENFRTRRTQKRA